MAGRFPANASLLNFMMAAGLGARFHLEMRLWRSVYGSMQNTNPPAQSGRPRMFWPQIVRRVAMMFCLLPPTRLALGSVPLPRCCTRRLRRRHGHVACSQDGHADRRKQRLGHGQLCSQCFAQHIAHYFAVFVSRNSLDLKDAVWHFLVQSRPRLRDESFFIHSL
jgi:hypothetical protein